MTEHYDIIIIGAGSGGLNMAGFMNRIGLEVLLIERSETTIGGDCLNYGCIPSKALIHISREVHAAKHTKRFGLSNTGSVDIHEVMQYVKERQDIIREHEHADYFRKKGMTVVIGKARFVSSNSVSVGDQIFSAKRIVIATGSRPRMIDIKGSEHVPVYTNETIFDIERLPDSLLVIGGGPIAFEIGQAFLRFGSKVALVNQDDHWLGKEDRDVVAVLKETLFREGAVFIENATVSEIQSDNNTVIQFEDGKTEKIHADALFIAIGRTINLDLDLEKGGIKVGSNGKLILNKYLQTTNRRVFAVGDVVGQHMFTHAAEMHVALIASNFFKPRFMWKRLNTSHMAWVTYTDPEIATFGQNEATLKEKRIRFETITQRFEENDRSITDNATQGFLKLHVDHKGRIYGGTMVGKDAGELVGELALAMTENLAISKVFECIHPYPTASRITKLAAGQFMAKKLTSRAKKLLRILY